MTKDQALDWLARCIVRAVAVGGVVFILGVVIYTPDAVWVLVALGGFGLWFWALLRDTSRTDR